MCLIKLRQRFEPLFSFAESRLAPLVILGARLLVARDFFTSGMTKLDHVLNGETDTLYALFEDYNVPFLPVKVAAWMGMCGELGLSALLALGLFARFGAAGLIVMSAVVYHADQNELAPFWAMICALIAVQGPGRLSLDALLFRRKTA